MRYICSLITVSDIEVSRYFYEKTLSQKVKYDFGENITFHGDFAIHLKSHFSRLIDNKEIKTEANNFELYFESDHPDKLVNQLRENNVQFIHDIKEQPWKQKVIRFYDPDKNIIEVGESMKYLAFRLKNEGMSIEEISKTISMPFDFINESIKEYEG